MMYMLVLVRGWGPRGVCWRGGWGVIEPGTHPPSTLSPPGEGGLAGGNGVAHEMGEGQFWVWAAGGPAPDVIRG